MQTCMTNEYLMELNVQRKDEERQEEEEKTEEPKRFTRQEMARRFSLFEKALLVFEAQDPNVEWYMKVQQPFRMESSATMSSVTRK